MSTKRQAEIRAAKEGKELDFRPNVRSKEGTSSHYVKNSELREEMIRCKEKGETSEKLALMFQQIATRLSSKLKYNNPMDREDCISAAVLDCLKYWWNYNPEVSDNAFAYITSICTNGFAKNWRSFQKIKFPDSIMISLSDNIYSL